MRWVFILKLTLFQSIQHTQHSKSHNTRNPADFADPVEYLYWMDYYKTY